MPLPDRTSSIFASIRRKAGQTALQLARCLEKSTYKLEAHHRHLRFTHEAIDNQWLPKSLRFRPKHPHQFIWGFFLWVKCNLGRPWHTKTKQNDEPCKSRNWFVFLHVQHPINNFYLPCIQLFSINLQGKSSESFSDLRMSFSSTLKENFLQSFYLKISFCCIFKLSHFYKKDFEMVVPLKVKKWPFWRTKIYFHQIQLHFYMTWCKCQIFIGYMLPS